jgi:plastocyanin
MHFSTSAFVELTLLSSIYAATWQVTVGANNALTFIPSVVNAQAGDMVQFNFVSQVSITAFAFAFYTKPT